MTEITPEEIIVEADLDFDAPFASEEDVLIDGEPEEEV